MIKLENTKKRVIIKKRRFVLVITVVLVIISCSIFYIGSKLNNNHSNNLKMSLKEKKIHNSPPTDIKMNLRESAVIYKKSNINSENIDVYKHIYKRDGHKIAYLTFDDGPSPTTTSGILKTLDKYNIKATFFIIGSMAIRYPDLVRKEFADKQSIGNHSYSHNYKYIYSNTNTFISDINKCETVLTSILGSKFTSKLVRFPGGSFGKRLKPFRESLRFNGYNYIDWNDITGDADGQDIPVNKLIDNLKKYTKGKEHVVILMHDASTKATTVQALPQVIKYLKSQKYSFKTLN